MTHGNLKVEGMSCDHCVQTIQKALGKLPGVDKVQVNLEGKEVAVDYDETKTDANTISSTIV
ncbi:MAG: copper ion binding protein, partial [Nitrospinaceae bacterium]|nr:heavy-metal-associated domain-containing protein [Nitrospinaceae bacterium]NIR55478.1 heavy-metal-associated domain-containing protein [Nitrospinaceae bacterium]NIS85918.1 heavy-metal-associated domain-containing protein [Nitrospinaceae bacterium]NIT82766.1 heavy-metal-associated domain-containing protein [Nitrospinaceae bacterium]NIU44971.1 heavy-metal-associated domain-containing protein [Nitrospinaceae bacterium]